MNFFPDRQVTLPDLSVNSIGGDTYPKTNIGTTSTPASKKVRDRDWNTIGRAVLDVTEWMAGEVSGAGANWIGLHAGTDPAPAGKGGVGEPGYLYPKASDGMLHMKLEGVDTVVGAGGSQTMQQTYAQGGSAPTLVTLDATRGGIIIRDAAVSIAAPLFRVQDSSSYTLFEGGPTRCTISVQEASTNTVLDPLVISRATTGTAAAGIGVGILFRAELDSGSQGDAAQMSASLSNATTGAADVHFFANSGGGLSERLTIFGAGRVRVGGGADSGDVFQVSGHSTLEGGLSVTGVGTLTTVDDSPTGTVLDAYTAARTTSGTASSGIGVAMLLRAHNASGSLADAARVAGILTTTTAGSEASAISFQVRTGGGALAEGMRLNADSSLTINGVAIDPSSPTLNYVLTYNGTKFVPAVAAGGGVTGSGTTNTITKWTGSGAVGNSSITDDGTTVAMVENVTLSTTKTMTVGSNVLIGSVADKLNASHLAIASQAIGDLLQASSTTAFARLASVASGSYLRSGGVTTASVWSTLTLPNAATTGDLMAATGTNAVGVIAAVATGQVLVSAGTSTVPAYSASPSLTGLTLSGNLVVSGNTTLGDTSSDLILLQGAVATSGSTIKSSPIMTLRGAKWNGSSSDNNDWDIQSATQSTSAGGYRLEFSHRDVFFGGVQHGLYMKWNEFGTISGGDNLTINGGGGTVNISGGGSIIYQLNQTQLYPQTTNLASCGLSTQQWKEAYARRYRSIGTATAAGDYALSAGWGSTASVAVTSGSNDTHGTITITSAGTGQGSNATITFTFKDGTWTTAPFCMVVMSGGTGTAAQPTYVTAATTLTITFPALVVTGSTYKFDYYTLGQ